MWPWAGMQVISLHLTTGPYASPILRDTGCDFIAERPFFCPVSWISRSTGWPPRSGTSSSVNRAKT